MKHLKKIRWLSVIVVTVLLLDTTMTLAAQGKERKPFPSIPADVVASYLHSIIRADRTIYSTFIVNRLHEKGILNADEAWEQKSALPLPAQFLQQSGRLVAETGSGIRFRLISLWPIYERNGPVTDFERTGLEVISEHPDQPYEGVVRSGKLKYFQAIYADKAVTKACVTCHNTHPLSPKRDFKLHDVMGGIVITIPLDN